MSFLRDVFQTADEVKQSQEKFKDAVDVSNRQAEALIRPYLSEAQNEILSEILEGLIASVAEHSFQIGYNSAMQTFAEAAAAFETKSHGCIKRAIITGATGAVGTALVKVLVSNGIEVLVFCRKGSKRNVQIPEHELVARKYCALNELAAVQNDTGKDYNVFYHFAWEGTTGAARNDMYLQNQNVRYALDAVAAAKRFGCHTFIGAGSQAEYGRVEGVLKSNTPAFPEIGYGMGKLCAGHMTREYAHQLGMKHIWTRILSIYGPNDGMQSMVMSTINKLRNDEVPEVTKGEQLWDYLYSGDAANAFRLLGEKGHDDKVYALGSGHAEPLAAYVEKIREIVAPNAEIRLGAISYSEKQVMHLEADISSLHDDLGWTPKISFSEGISMTLNTIRGGSSLLP